MISMYMVTNVAKGVSMATKQISLRLDEELIYQIKEFEVQSE